MVVVFPNEPANVGAPRFFQAFLRDCGIILYLPFENRFYIFQIARFCKVQNTVHRQNIFFGLFFHVFAGQTFFKNFFVILFYQDDIGMFIHNSYFCCIRAGKNSHSQIEHQIGLGYSDFDLFLFHISGNRSFFRCRHLADHF